MLLRVTAVFSKVTGVYSPTREQRESVMKRAKTQNAEADGAAPSYQDIAAVMLQALGTIEAAIPRSALTQNLRINYVRRRLGVTREMIASAITTSAVSPRFSGIMDASEARDTLALYDALQPVFAQMNAVGQDLRFAIEARFVKTSREALHLYAAAKRIAAEELDEVEVAAHLQAMASHMPKGKGRRKKPAPEQPVTGGEAPLPTTASQENEPT